MSQLENIKSRVLSKQSSKEYDLIEVWHYFMLNYGYIPFDVFINIDAGIKEKLLEYINEHNKQMNQSMSKGKNRKKR